MNIMEIIIKELEEKAANKFCSILLNNYYTKYLKAIKTDNHKEENISYFFIVGYLWALANTNIITHDERDNAINYLIVLPLSIKEQE